MRCIARLRLRLRRGRLLIAAALPVAFLRVAVGPFDSLALAQDRQEVAPEYRLKAEYLVNIIKYVEWPENSRATLLICVAGQNPFGTMLEGLIRNEQVSGKALATEVILEPKPDCDVVFTPRTSNISAYLKAAAGAPTLTIGETPRFVDQGGMIRFFTENDSVLFEINRGAVEKARLRISSRLLQLARIVEPNPVER
jgi:uncharacterized protein DUF4154